jgi:hypothetical protein
MPQADESGPPAGREGEVKGWAVPPPGMRMYQKNPQHSFDVEVFRRRKIATHYMNYKTQLDYSSQPYASANG